MRKSLVQFVDVRIDWASHHIWQPREALYGYPTAAHALWLILRGNVDVRVAGTSWRLSADEAFLAPVDAPRDIATISGAEWLSIGLEATLFGQIDLLRLLGASVHWQPKDDERPILQGWMCQLVQEWSDRTEVSELICEGLGRAILGLCWRMLSATDLSTAVHQSSPRWLAAALRHIHDEPGTSIERLTNVVGLSPAQLRRSFHEWLGVSPRVYIQQSRLSAARQLLETTDLPISRIAEQLGFQSLPHFTRLFKQAFGMPPARYRLSAKQAKV